MKTKGHCYGSLCNKLITIVIYYLESCLFCIVYLPKSFISVLFHCKTAFVTKT